MRADDTIANAINNAQHLENIRGGSLNPYSDPRAGGRTYQSMSNTQYVPMEIDAARSKLVKCYNCRKLGHVKRNCQQPIKSNNNFRGRPNIPRVRGTYTSPRNRAHQRTRTENCSPARRNGHHVQASRWTQWKET